MFQETKDFLPAAESLVIGRSFNPKGRWTSGVIDGVLHVPWFLMAGMQGLIAIAIRGLALAVVWWLLLWTLVYMTSGSRPHPSLMGMAFLGLLMGLGSVVLELPSGLLRRRIDESHVSKLAASLTDKAANGLDIELLQEGVAIVSAASSRRLSFVGWVLGLVWAVMAWLAAQWIFAPDVAASVRSGAISYGVALVIVFLFLGAAFASYREAHRTLSETIAFAFLQARSIRSNHLPRSPDNASVCRIRKVRTP